MKCYAVSTKKGENLILTKTQFDVFYASHPSGYQCVKCNSIEEAEIALRNINNKKSKKRKNTVHEQETEYIMFYDSEFNCSEKRDVIQEIVSMGAVICDKEGNEIDRFYSTVKPLKNPKLTRRCKDLTGLSQSQIDVSESLYWVSKRFCEWCEGYNVTSIYTLGRGDSLQLKRSCQFHKDFKLIMQLATTLTDIRPELNKMVDKEIASLSLSNLKAVCGLSEQVNHNALLDAVDLKNVYFSLKSGKYDQATVRKIIDDQIEKQRYQQARNVRNERIIAPNEIMEAKNKVVEFMEVNATVIDKAVLKAIIDDLNDLFVSDK